MVKAYGAGVVLEYKRGSGFVFRILLDEQNVWMPKIIQDLILPAGGALERFAFGRRRRCRREVKTDKALASGQLEVLGLPVLIKAQGIFEDQFREPIITHAAGTLGLADAGLFHGAAYGAGGGSIELARWGQSQAISLTATKGSQDTSAGGAASFRRAISQTDPQASTSLKTAVQCCV